MMHSFDSNSFYKNCNLCARGCGVDRTGGERGFCGASNIPAIARAALHMWEEPIISGSLGSGTIFFRGCSIGCVFCQNSEISSRVEGGSVSPEQLASIMLGLEQKGAHNINFVTPTHFTPSIVEAIELAKVRGLSIPIVYNTGSYDRVETIRLLDGFVDIYLPDYKYYRSSTAMAYSSAPDYPEVAFSAIEQMVRQRPNVVIQDGLIKEGVIIRLLLLPSHVAEAKLALKRLYSAFGNSVYYSLMSQYTPMPNMLPPLDREVTQAEYRELVDYADRLGIINAFIQDKSSSGELYIPEFDIK